MDLAATSQDVVLLGPRIYMQLSRYCRKGTTSLCADTCLLLYKYSVTAARMSGCNCRHPPPLRVKCPAAALTHIYARALTLKRMYPKLNESVLFTLTRLLTKLLTPSNFHALCYRGVKPLEQMYLNN
jgi:hypothetical protein